MIAENPLRRSAASRLRVVRATWVTFVDDSVAPDARDDCDDRDPRDDCDDRDPRDDCDARDEKYTIGYALSTLSRVHKM